MQYSTAIKLALLAYVSSFIFSIVILPEISQTQRVNIDPDRFGQIASNVTQGNGFVYEEGGSPVLERTPLYTYLLAGLFSVTNGFSVTAVQTCQALLHALTSFLLYVIVAKLYHQKPAMIAQLVFALHPLAIWYAGRIWVETTFTFLFLVAAISCVLLFEAPTSKRSVGTGVAIGLGCLAKPVLLLVPVLLPVFLAGRFGFRGFKAGVVALIATLVVVAPWTLRNYQISDRFIPVNTSLGFNLVQGDIIARDWPAPDTWLLDYWHAGWQRADSMLAPNNLTWQSAEGDRMLTKAVLSEIAGSPFDALLRTAKNFCTLWFLSESKPKSVVIGLLQVPLVLAAFSSCLLMERDTRKKLFPVILLVMYYILVHAVIVGWGRYSMPLIPLLLMLTVPLMEAGKVRLNRRATG